ncbi:MAG TPA: adenylyl-sulfate kinase, partial [Polyangiales bacterium]|nr:adenylyl-sulfate kinase [Polyangiales bacterium]
TLRLQDEIDISRGDMLVFPDNRPRVTRSFEATLVWMHERPLDTEKTYLIKHTTQVVRAQIDKIHSKLELTTLKELPTKELGLNDIARVTVTCHRALYVDPYDQNRSTGAFILVDSLYNTTVGAGMIRAQGDGESSRQSLDDAFKEIRAGSGLAAHTQVSPRERRERFGQSGATVWLTGLPGSGRWSLAYALERKLFDLGRTAHVVTPFSKTLESITSAAHACTDAGLITICAYQAYKRADRAKIKQGVGDKRFVEVFVDTPSTLCAERRPDVAGTFGEFETPTQADLVVKLDEQRVHVAIEAIVDLLEKHGQFDEL